MKNGSRAPTKPGAPAEPARGRRLARRGRLHNAPSTGSGRPAGSSGRGIGRHPRRQVHVMFMGSITMILVSLGRPASDMKILYRYLKKYRGRVLLALFLATVKPVLLAAGSADLPPQSSTTTSRSSPVHGMEFFRGVSVLLLAAVGWPSSRGWPRTSRTTSSMSHPALGA